MNEQIMQQIAAIAQQYMQSQSPEAAMQLLQMVAQSQDPQLLMMAADGIAAAVTQGGMPADQGGMPPQGGAPAGAPPMGQNGMQMPTYGKGGKLSVRQKLKQKMGKSPHPDSIAAK